MTRRGLISKKTGLLLLLAGAAGSIAWVTAQMPTVPEQAPSAAGETTATQMQQGARLLQEKGCSYCHGPSGAGTAKGPSLVAIGARWNKTQIESQIRNGGKGMPAFAEVLDSSEIEELGEYLVLKRGKSAKQAESKRRKGNDEK